MRRKFSPVVMYLLVAGLSIAQADVPTNPTPPDDPTFATPVANAVLTFQWEAVFSGGSLDKYVLYLDPNQTKVANATPASVDLQVKQEIAAGSLSDPQMGEYLWQVPPLDAQLYWRVDTVKVDPNVFNGPVWAFAGPPTTPVITNQPDDFFLAPDPDTLLFAANNAEFTIEYVSANAATVEWFKSSAPATPLTSGADYTITTDTTSSTLTILNPGGGDVDSYFAEVTDNTLATTGTSDTAALEIAFVLRHRYSFNPGQELLDTGNLGGADLTITDPGDPNITVVNGEMIFGPHEDILSGDADAHHAEIPAGTISAMTGNQGTFQFWFTLAPAYDRTGQANIFDFGSISPNSGFQFLVDTGGGPNDEDRLVLRGVQQLTGTLPFPAEQTLITIVWNQNNDGKIRYFRNDSQIKGGRDLNITLAEITDTANLLGRSNVETQEVLEGSLAEVRIYDVALTDAWIVQSFVDGPDALPNLCLNDPGTLDANDDCRVNYVDFADLNASYLECGRFAGCD